MKHKETVDDRAIKDASATERAFKKEDSPEMEDPKGFARKKEIQKSWAALLENGKSRKLVRTGKEATKPYKQW